MMVFNISSQTIFICEVKTYAPKNTVSTNVSANFSLPPPTGLWLDYIKTELLYPGGDPGKVGGLHWRAVKELQPELTADFISKYSLLQLN